MERVHGCIADQDIDLAEFCLGLLNKRLELFLVVYVARNGDGPVAALCPIIVDVGGDSLAGALLARGDDDIGAVLRHAFGYGLADAFGRASDDGGFVSKIEKFHVEKSYVNVSGCYVGQCAVGVTYLAWKYLWIEPRSRPRRG